MDESIKQSSFQRELAQAKIRAREKYGVPCPTCAGRLIEPVVLLPGQHCTNCGFTDKRAMPLPAPANGSKKRRRRR